MSKRYLHAHANVPLLRYSIIINCIENIFIIFFFEWRYNSSPGMVLNACQRLDGRLLFQLQILCWQIEGEKAGVRERGRRRGKHLIANTLGNLTQTFIKLRHFSLACGIRLQPILDLILIFEGRRRGLFLRCERSFYGKGSLNSE